MTIRSVVEKIINERIEKLRVLLSRRYSIAHVKFIINELEKDREVLITALEEEIEIFFEEWRTVDKVTDLILKKILRKLIGTSGRDKDGGER